MAKSLMVKLLTHTFHLYFDFALTEFLTCFMIVLEAFLVYGQYYYIEVFFFRSKNHGRSRVDFQSHWKYIFISV